MPIESAVRVVKLSYSYEHWDVFGGLLEPVLAYVRVCLRLYFLCFCRNLLLAVFINTFCVLFTCFMYHG